MKMQKYSAKSYLNCDDVRDGPLHKRIREVKEGKFDKPDLQFDDGDMLGLNRNNVKTLIRAYGEDSDSWIGCVIELSLGTTKYQGDDKETITVVPVTKKDPPPPAADEMNDSIPF